MTRALVGNVADEGQVKYAERVEQRTEMQREDDLHWVMSEPAGRRFIWDLLSDCHLFTVEPDSRPDAELRRREGERNVGMKLLVRIQEEQPDLFLLMQKEYIDSKRPKPQPQNGKQPVQKGGLIAEMAVAEDEDNGD